MLLLNPDSDLDSGFFLWSKILKIYIYINPNSSKLRRIRIQYFRSVRIQMQIRIQIQGFGGQNWEKKFTAAKKIFFDQKLLFTYP